MSLFGHVVLNRLSCVWRTSGQQKAIDELGPKYLIPFSQQTLDLNSLFGQNEADSKGNMSSLNEPNSLASHPAAANVL
jgi:hypothetical protein